MWEISLSGFTRKPSVYAGCRGFAGATKYHGNNGLDHVVQFVDPADGVTKTMVIDSKQLAINGTASLDPRAAGTAELARDVMQLSDDSLGVIADRLNGTPAGKAVEAAIEKGTLIKAVAYVSHPG